MNDEWHLNDGTVLCGNDAAEYPERQSGIFDDLSKQIAVCLKECDEPNEIDHSEPLTDCAPDAGERISMIEIEPEMLLREISYALHSLWPS